MTLLDHLALQARILRRRDEYLPRILNDGAAWHILCELARAQIERRAVSIKVACLASHVPATTALRHIDNLIEQGFAERHPDTTDARRQWLSITERGFGAVATIFELPPALILRFEGERVPSSSGQCTPASRSGSAAFLTQHASGDTCG